ACDAPTGGRRSADRPDSWEAARRTRGTTVEDDDEAGPSAEGVPVHPQADRAVAGLWTTSRAGPPWPRSPCHDVPVPTASDRVPAPSAPARDPDGRARIVEAATLPADTAPVRAALHPGTLVIVRDDSTVQVGIAPDRAVMVTAPRSCGPHRLAALLEDLVGGADLGAAAAPALPARPPAPPPGAPRGRAALRGALAGGAALGPAPARAGIAGGDLPGVPGIRARLTELGHVNVASPATTARSRAGATPR